MFSAELEGERVLLVVAQKPFEAGDNVVNLFCNLRPLLRENGTEAKTEDFPANGLVWWMVRPNARRFAEPGRLLTATLEESRESGATEKAWYQVNADTIEPARPSKIVEIVTAPGNWVADAREIVASNRQLSLDHPPMERVYLSWQANLYGPLKTDGNSDSEGRWSISFSPDDPGNLVNKIPESALQQLPAGKLHDVTAVVSPANRLPDAYDRGATCKYRLVSEPDFSRYVEKAGTTIVLEGDESLLRRIAKDVLSRKERQEFIKHLERFSDRISNDPSNGDAEKTRAIKALSSRLRSTDSATEELARSLLESGLLEQRLKPLLDDAEARHIEKHIAKLQADIDARVEKARSDLESLERDRDARKQRLEQDLSRRMAEHEKELGEKHREFERDCELERERLRLQKQELDRQSVALSGNLQQVALQITEGRDALVNQFLAIAPLLQRFGMLSGISQQSQSQTTPESRPHDIERAGFRLPAFAIGSSPKSLITEETFYKRFREHVERSGYRYRNIDLAGFHLGVKCNDLTVLGGPPGTGKSSLPRLYAEALIGDDDDHVGGSYLHIGVSPSWLDMRDLLGQTNLLDHTFQPAESGLYAKLICAQEEQRARGPDSLMYVICLDEMNLAQVEHYFSGFLNALERVSGQREIPCFSSEMVRPDDPFASWPVLNLPPSIRFIGTVNFDETTRQLSQRVLDRCNLIRLAPTYSLDADPPRKLVAQGPAVTQGHLSGWVKESAGLDPSHGKLLDDLREPLEKMGCPLNPRRYHAIRRVLSNVPAFVCSADEALDLQIAQRILPQVRNLFRPGAREGFKAFNRILEIADHRFPESLALLAEIEERETGDELFSNGVGE